MDMNNLNFLATRIQEVFDPSVYEKNRGYINKPMEDITFGHLLNINWENITDSFNVLKNYALQAVYVDIVSQANTPNTLVMRGSAGGIQVGDIFTDTAIGNVGLTNGIGIAYKGADNKINYTTNYDSIRSLIGAKKAGESDVNLLWSGNISLRDSSTIVTLPDDARKYSVLVGYVAPNRWEGRPPISVLLMPNLDAGGSAENRNGGASAHFLWDGGVSVSLRSHSWRDPADSLFSRIYGLL